MNSFNSLAALRYSCRSYKPDAVGEAEINQLLEAARLAPSACNRQPWRFMVIGPDNAQGRAAVSAAYPREWVGTAPCYIVVCGVPAEAWVRPADGHNHVDVDIAIATEHICLAATAMSLATCWICNFDPAVLKEKLALPEGVEPMVILPVGHPADTEPEKRRKNLADILL
ncbi:MAG: nitroreductase [Bacteroidales bacterium]|nr:nitroreductase [Bacteroidales bacterium]